VAAAVIVLAPTTTAGPTLWCRATVTPHISPSGCRMTVASRRRTTRSGASCPRGAGGRSEPAERGCRDRCLRQSNRAGLGGRGRPVAREPAGLSAAAV